MTQNTDTPITKSVEALETREEILQAMRELERRYNVVQSESMVAAERWRKAGAELARIAEESALAIQFDAKRFNATKV